MMKLFKKTAAALCFTSIFVTGAFAQINFSNLDLNAYDNLLFTAHHEIPGSPSYTSLFVTHLNVEEESSSKLLTCFPERMELLSQGKILQVRNRYGIARYNTENRTLTWNNDGSGGVFMDSLPCQYLQTSEYSVSPDGNWSCFIKKTDDFSGSLILKNNTTDEETVLLEKCQFNYDKVNVKWSFDSSVLLYEKNGCVYFLTPSTVSRRFTIQEEFRCIGKGNINCVNFCDDGKIIYIDNDIVYEIQQNELYTRGLYSSLAGKGTLLGRLPVAFDENEDVFFVSSDASSLSVIQKSKILSVYSFNKNVYDFAQIKNIYSLTTLEGSPLNSFVFWNSLHEGYLWVEMLSYDTGKKISGIYSLGSKLDKVVEIKSASKIKLSPDKKNIAIGSTSSLFVYDINTWENRIRLSGEKVISFEWNNSFSFYAGGESTVRFVELDPLAQYSPKVTVLFLSSVEKASWVSSTVIAKTPSYSQSFVYDSTRNVWNERDIIMRTTLVEKNDGFRVFLGTSSNDRYSNSIYVRSLGSQIKTYPVFEETGDASPVQRKIAFVFEALDDSEGLGNVLDCLDVWNMDGVFFINGEFIKRYPKETNQIAASPYECASMFYTDADLTSKAFVLDSEFIKRGLARNEDAFFNETGRELSLLWHAPFYKVTDEIISFAGEAGYYYADCTFVDFASDDAISIISEYIALLEKLPVEESFIISIPLGKTQAVYGSELHENLDLFISCLLDHGCTIVPLREIL